MADCQGQVHSTASASRVRRSPDAIDRDQPPLVGRGDINTSEAIVAPMREPRRRTTKLSALTAALLAAVLSGCGQQTTSTTALTASGASTARTISTTTREASTTARKPGPRPARAGHQSAGGLAYSTASAQIVQTQPASGSCHSIGTGLSSRPDPHCTPGALNPQVTQATISNTICKSGWTATVRPRESITEPEKQASMAAYGDTGPISSYEYDHFVPLELGGASNDPRNLWPEPGASPNPKDAVEDELKQKVCEGQITLAHAQRAITTNWTTLAGAVSAPSTPPSTSSTTGLPQAAPAAPIAPSPPPTTMPTTTTTFTWTQTNPTRT